MRRPALIARTQCVVVFAMTPDGVREAFDGNGYLRVALEAGGGQPAEVEGDQRERA